MSEPSDFESFLSDVAVSPCSSLDNVNAITTDHSKSTKSQRNKICLSINDKICTYDPLEHDAPFTDSDHSLLEAPKLLNASSPSSVCSTRPLEWDSGADVGYNIMPKLQNQDMSTIERIAVSSLVYNSSSTSFNCEKTIGIKTKSNSLINLNGVESSKGQRSASFEALKCITNKSDTLPKYRSPMASSLSMSTVVHKIDSLNIEHIKQLNKKRINLMFEQQEKGFDKLNSDSNKEQNSSESSKESNSTLGSADTAGSWVAKEFRNSTNTTTDRVNSFEYLPGNAYYNNRDDGLDDYLDKEIKSSTKMLVEAMKQNGLTDESQRKEIFKEIIENFLKNYVHKDNNSSIKSTSDSGQTPIKQDFTSQTSNTANTVVNNQTNNHSSTITFSSPITSSRYGDEIESKYDESSMESGRHINLQKCKSKKLYTPTHKQKNQSVQCTIQSTDIIDNLKQPSCTKSNTSTSKKECLESSPKKVNVQSKLNYKDVNKEFKKHIVWFHSNYMKTERENQMLWINNQISHLNNLKKLFNTHEELKKNWNSYKQKQTTNNKSRGLHPESNSSSDITTTTKTSSDITTTTKTSSDISTNTKIDSTISSKHFSVTSRSDDTDIESSITVCNHVHYKKGILVDELQSMKNCCKKTIHNIEEKDKQQNTHHELKNTCDQTELMNKTNLKNNSKRSNWSDSMYIVEHQLKPISNTSSMTYDIIFKPTSRCSKETDDDSVSKKSKQQRHLVSVACQTNKIPLPSLQEYLMTNRPDYVCRAKERQNILTDIAKLRDNRKQLKRNMLITHNYENKIPPNPLAIKRVMSQKEMRKLTERKYRKCSEVKNKKVQINRKEEYKTNKIMVNIFNKRLQKKTLKGKVDLSNSISVCSM